MPIISNLPKKKFTQTDGDNRYLQLSGASAMQGDLDVGGNKITNIGTPSESTDAANKGYVDTHVNDALEGNYIPTSEKGTANGVAELDSTGRVPSTQLPSYVDDVAEYATLSAFPQAGEDGKIYVAEDSNLTYRWSGSGYVPLNPSLALGETSQTAYRGDRGKIAYDHSQATGNPHGTTADDVGALSQDAADDRYLQLSGGTINGTLEVSEGVSLSTYNKSNRIDMLAIDIDGIDCELSFETPEAGIVYFTQLGTKVNASAPYDIVNKQSLDNRLTGYVPTTRTVNNKALSSNVELTAGDIGAATPADVTAVKPIPRTVTLSSSGWSNNQQTVTVQGVAANTSGQIIDWGPADETSYEACGSAKLFLKSSTSANQLIFKALGDVPTSNISINIRIQEAQS